MKTTNSMYPVVTDKEFGAYLKKIREDAGLAQKSLAGLLGLSHGRTLFDWEQGLAMPSAANITLISQHCNVHIGVLRALFISVKMYNAMVRYEGKFKELDGVA